MAKLQNRVVVVGDSHAKILAHPLIQSAFPGIKFILATVSGATVSGLENPNSKTQALPIIRDRIKKAGARHAIIMLGEVDTGFVIWYRAKKYGLPVTVMLDQALANYRNLLIELSEQLQVICISTPLPTIKDGSDWGEVVNARSEINATQCERTELTLKYNKAMQQFCIESGIRYLMLDEVSVGENGLIRDDLINSDIADHHYNAEIYAEIIIMGLRNLIKEQYIANDIYMENIKPESSYGCKSQNDINDVGQDSIRHAPPRNDSIDSDEKLKLNSKLAKLKRRYADAELFFLSFPKSGRTWVRTVLAHYLSIRYQLPFDIEFEIHNDSINQPCFSHNFFDVYRHIDLDPVVLEKEKINSLPLVLLVRDPRDVCASYYHHIRNRDKLWVHGPLKFGFNRTYGIVRQAKFVNMLLDVYSTHPGPKLLIKYEQLRKNPAQGFREIISMVDCNEVDSSVLNQAIERSSFERMQKEEIYISQYGAPGKIARIGIKQWNGDVSALKVRRGKVGGYFSEFGYFGGIALSFLPAVFRLIWRLRLKRF